MEKATVAKGQVQIMTKFKQARRTATFKKPLYMRKKKTFARSRSRLPNLGSQRIPTVVSAMPPGQRSLFLKGKCMFSSVKDALLSTGNVSYPSLRNTVFSSCKFAFLRLREAAWSTVNFAVSCAMRPALSTRNFVLACFSNGMKSLLVAVLSVCWWCWRNLRRSFDVTKNILFPSCTCLRELAAVKQQVQKLEMELSLLQEVIKKGGNIGSLEYSSSPSCQKCSVLTTPLSDLSSNLLQPSFPSPHMAPSLCPCLLLPSTLHPPLLLPPTPPPPPPPPPLPPPTFFVQKPVVLPKKAVNSAALKAAPSKKEGPVQVTLKDLLNVKLKKTSDNVEKQMRSPKKGRTPLVRISDLQSVNLKRSSSLPSNHVPNILISPSKDPLDLRKHLKKVNLKRSPGGTPIYDRENMDSGTGLTPIMTRALKQKFQMALPKSPPPMHFCTDNRSFD